MISSDGGASAFDFDVANDQDSFSPFLIENKVDYGDRIAEGKLDFMKNGEAVLRDSGTDNGRCHSQKKVVEFQ